MYDSFWKAPYWENHNCVHTLTPKTAAEKSFIWLEVQNVKVFFQCLLWLLNSLQAGSLYSTSALSRKREIKRTSRETRKSFSLRLFTASLCSSLLTRLAQRWAREVIVLRKLRSKCSFNWLEPGSNSQSQFFSVCFGLQVTLVKKYTNWGNICQWQNN